MIVIERGAKRGYKHLKVMFGLAVVAVKALGRLAGDKQNRPEANLALV